MYSPAGSVSSDGVRSSSEGGVYVSLAMASTVMVAPSGSDAQDTFESLGISAAMRDSISIVSGAFSRSFR